MFSKWKYLFYIHDSIYAIKKQIKNERRKQNLSEKNIKLVIAEKPSVAQSIAKVIGADKREDGYLEGKNNRTVRVLKTPKTESSIRKV